MNLSNIFIHSFNDLYGLRFTGDYDLHLSERFTIYKGKTSFFEVGISEVLCGLLLLLFGLSLMHKLLKKIVC